MKRVASFAPTLFLLASLPATAAVHNGTFQSDEAQATTCSVGSTTQAVGTVTYDDVTHLFSWSYSYGDNAPDFDDGALFGGGSETISHFHGPANPGVPAGVQVGTGTGNPNAGSATISASQGSDLLAGLWYHNIHSSSCGGGEIRGQVLFATPTPALSSRAAVGLLACALAATALFLRKRSA